MPFRKVFRNAKAARKNKQQVSFEHWLIHSIAESGSKQDIIL